jgi:hypothetical protein
MYDDLSIGAIMATAKRPGGEYIVRGQRVDANGKLLEAEDAESVPGSGSGNLDGFPGGSILLAAGFDSPEKIRAASDEDLLALDGIGEGTLKKIREQQG